MSVLFLEFARSVNEIIVNVLVNKVRCAGGGMSIVTQRKNSSSL